MNTTWAGQPQWRTYRVNRLLAVIFDQQTEMAADNGEFKKILAELAHRIATPTKRAGLMDEKNLKTTNHNWASFRKTA